MEIRSFPILMEVPQHVPGRTAPGYPADLYVGTYVPGESLEADRVTDVAPLATSPADDRDPCWSPDGTPVFVSDREGSDHLYAAVRNTRHPIVLLEHEGASAPALSPDGRVLVYTAFDGSRPVLWARQGGRAAPVDTGGLPAWTPTFAPDGRTVVFSVYDGHPARYGLHALDLHNGALRQLTSGLDFEPSFAPDGKTLVFRRRMLGQDHIWVLNVASGDAAPLTHQTGTYRAPRYSPDGSRILFAQSRSDPEEDDGVAWDLCAIPAAGGASHVVREDTIAVAFCPQGVTPNLPGPPFPTLP